MICPWERVGEYMEIGEMKDGKKEIKKNKVAGGGRGRETGRPGYRPQQDTHPPARPPSIHPGKGQEGCWRPAKHAIFAPTRTRMPSDTPRGRETGGTRAQTAHSHANRQDPRRQRHTRQPLPASHGQPVTQAPRYAREGVETLTRKAGRQDIEHRMGVRVEPGV